jgi:DNA-binding MarR family transcriptional regulator
MRKSKPAEKSTDSDDDTLSHWVKLAFVTMRREMEASLRKSGMTVTQWRALGVLHHKSLVTHSELVKQLEIEAPSVTSLVNGMARKGWVTQKRSSADARVKQLSLTPRGKSMIEGVRGATSPVEQRMAASLSVEERDALKKLLRTMIEGMHKSPLNEIRLTGARQFS